MDSKKLKPLEFGFAETEFNVDRLHPHAWDEELNAKVLKQIGEHNKFVDAWTLDRDTNELIEVQGCIGDEYDEMNVKFKNGETEYYQWFTLDKQEALSVQLATYEAYEKDLEYQIKRLSEEKDLVKLYKTKIHAEQNP